MENEILIKFIQHSDIQSQDINKIIALKQQHWPYSFSSQKEWIKNNLTANDYHLLVLTSNETLIGYMNLVVRKINNNPILGIGNVCINKTHEHQGFGILLMQLCKHYSNQLSTDCALLCKSELIPFYEKSGFYLYGHDVNIHNEKCSCFLMFSTPKYLEINEFEIDKSF